MLALCKKSFLVKKNNHEESQVVFPALHHYEIRSTQGFVNYPEKKATEKRYTIYKITRFDTASRINPVGKTNSPALQNEISNFDLIAKEFKVYKHCYKKFNSKPVESANIFSDANSVLDNESSTCSSKSNYEEVKKYLINKKIIAMK